MKYKIDDNPPPRCDVSRGSSGKNGDVWLALELMRPGQGVLFTDKRQDLIVAISYFVKELTSHRYETEKRGEGCYVWCIAKDETP